MKFAVQHHLLGLGDRFAEAFAEAKTLGCDGVEVTWFGRTIDDETADRIAEASASTGVPVAAVCGGYRNWIGHFDEALRLEAVADIGASMERIARFGGGGLIAPAAYGMFTKSLPPHTPPRDEQGDAEALSDSLRRIAEYAETTGVTFYLEPLNRYEDHMVNRVEQAAALVDAVGCGKLKVMADFYHMNIEETNLAETIHAYREKIGYYHLSDSNRYLPGEGHIDFAGLLRRVQAVGFEGFLSIECRIRNDARKSIASSLTALREALYNHSI